MTQEYLYNLVTGKIKGPLAGLLRGVLFLLSFVYGAGVRLLSGIYLLKPVRLDAKVISVGNVTLGGTGKTTLVEYICSKFVVAGERTAVLSRGYKRECLKGACSLGDEPAMLQEKLPRVAIVVDKDRVNGAQRAIAEHGAHILVLDDGFQQWRIAKDLEIVAVDAANPFGNKRLIPAGFLREPLSSLRRAQVFVITQVAPGQDLASLRGELSKINPQALIVESVHQPLRLYRMDFPMQELELELLKGRSAAVFSGIGNPAGFENCLKGLGVEKIKSFRFFDHHNYSLQDYQEIAACALKENLELVITTAKDAVKLKGIGVKDPALLVLEVQLKITANEAEFDRRLLQLLAV